MSAPLSIPAETFLLLTKDNGRQRSTSYRRYAVMAAALIELALRERIDLSQDRNPRITVTDPTPTGDSALDQVIEVLAQKDRTKLRSAVVSKRPDIARTVGQQLAARGIVEAKKGLFTTSWPVLDPAPQAAVHARLAAALHHDTHASAQDAILLSILKGTKVGYVIIREDVPDMRRGDVLARIDELVVPPPVGPIVHALKRQIEAAQAAAA